MLSANGNTRLHFIASSGTFSPLDISDVRATLKAMKHPKNKNLSVDALGAMVQRGFTAMETRFDHLEHRLDRFEKVILADYGRRLKRLEADVDYLKDALALR